MTGQAELRQTIQAASNKSEAFNRFVQWLFFGGEGIIASNDRAKQRKRIKYNHLIALPVVHRVFCVLCLKALLLVSSLSHCLNAGHAPQRFLARGDRGQLPCRGRKYASFRCSSNSLAMAFRPFFQQPTLEGCQPSGRPAGGHSHTAAVDNMFTAALLRYPDKSSTPAGCRRGRGHRSSTTAQCHGLVPRRVALAPE
jgi:Tn3 transposase DDE domain